MTDLFAQLQQYEKNQAQKFPTSGTIAGIDGGFVDVAVRGSSAILRHVQCVGTPTSTNQLVVLTWENGIPTAHITGGLSASAATALIRGPQGPQGEKGDKGDPGVQGPKGDTGTIEAVSPLTMIALADTPDAPPAGEMSIYPKTDNKFYKLAPDGTETEVGSGGGGSVSLSYNITPTGAVDGSNKVFTFPAFVPGSLQLFRDGQLMRPGGHDYTETDPAAGTITFVSAPVTGSVILGSYQATVSTTGNADTLDGYHASAFSQTNHTHTLLSGQTVLSPDFQITAANGVYQDTGLSVTLPAGGTYAIDGCIRAACQSLDGAPYIVVKLYNATDGADVPDTETLIALSSQANTGAQATGYVNTLITVAASKVIKVYAYRQGANQYAVSFISSNTAGRSRLRYLKVG